MQILIYQSLWSEIVIDDPMPLSEQRKKYELTDDGFVRNVRAFVRNEDGDVLMLHDRRYGRWAVPGGKVDKWQSLEQALDMEIREELGVTIISRKYLGGRKGCMRGSKWINKRMAHYYDVRILWTPRNNEADKSKDIAFLKLHYNDDNHLTAVTVRDETFDDPATIYDIFPGLHTFADVLPYMPQDPIESERDVFHIPDAIDLAKTYQQWYDTEKREYCVEEVTSE